MKIYYCRFFLILLGMAFSGSGLGAGAVFAKFDGVEGESRAAGFEKWIDVVSLGFKGHIGSGEAGSMELIKRIDKSTPLLARSLGTGKIITAASIVMRKSDGDGKQRSFAKLELRDIRILGISHEGNAEANVIIERVKITFRQIQYSYVESDGTEVASFVEEKDEIDTDNDGMTDRFEDFYGFNKAVPDGDLDDDKDGYTNRQEFELGLNPKSSASTFRLKAQRPKEGENGVRLRWPAKPGVRYRILTSPDFSKPFTLFREVTAESLEGEIDLGQLGIKGFYRIEKVDE